MSRTGRKCFKVQWIECIIRLNGILETWYFIFEIEEGKECSCVNFIP